MRVGGAGNKLATLLMRCVITVLGKGNQKQKKRNARKIASSFSTEMKFEDGRGGNRFGNLNTNR